MGRILLAALVIAAAGCEVTATQLLVFVQTDLDREAGEIDAFDLTVRGPDLEPVPLEQDQFSLDEVSLPASFGVAPRGRDSSRTVQVEVGARLDERALFTTRAHTSYVEHERLRLDMFLARRCRTEGPACEALGLTCDQDGCRDPDELPATPDLTRLPAEWSAAFDAPNLDTLVADSIRVAVDGASNVVVAGSFTDAISIGGHDHEDQGSRAGFVIRLPPEGGAPQWHQHLHSDDTGFVDVLGLAVDPATGSTTLVGTFQGELVAGELRRPAAGDQDGFVASLDAAGNVVDVQTYGSADSKVVFEDVALGSAGAVAVTGAFHGSVRFGEVRLDNPADGPSLAVAVLGGPTPFACSIAERIGYGVALGPDGRAHVAAGTVGSTVSLLSFAEDCSVVDLSLGGSLFSTTRVEVDPGGRVVLGAGMSEAGLVDGDELDGAHGGTDGLVVSFDAEGSFEWRRYLGAEGQDDLHDLAIDRFGTVYAVGSLNGTARVDGWPDELAHAGGSDGMAAAFAADGTTLWARSFGGEDRDHLSGIAYDPATGAVIVVGLDTGPAVFGTEELPAGVVVYRFVP